MRRCRASARGAVVDRIDVIAVASVAGDARPMHYMRAVDLLVRRVRSFFVASEFWREPLVRSWRALGEKVVVVLPLPMSRTNACDSIGARVPHRMQYKTAQEFCAFVLVRRRKRQRRQKNFQLADRRRSGHRRHRVVLLARSACVCA